MSEWAEVSYDIGTYSGTLRVVCDEDDDSEAVIAKAKAQLKRKAGGSIYPGGPCYESWKVIERGTYEEDE